MQIRGIDFTSRPRPQKPITCAECTLSGDNLQLDRLLPIATFKQFEELLGLSGPWVLGADFPFGLPRPFIEHLGRQINWEEYVSYVAEMTRDELGEKIKNFRDAREAGAKHPRRRTDEMADARSPLMWYGVPVGKMFFEGARLLMASPATIRPFRETDPDRIVIEAYPALVARWALDSKKAPYKSDVKAKQTEEKRNAREQIVVRLCSSDLQEVYGFALSLSEERKCECINDPSGDKLDSLLCAIQAAWAYTRPDFGIPEPWDQREDRNEGWIVDPSQLREP